MYPASAPPLVLSQTSAQSKDAELSMMQSSAFRLEAALYGQLVVPGSNPSPPSYATLPSISSIPSLWTAPVSMRARKSASMATAIAMVARTPNRAGWRAISAKLLDNSFLLLLYAGCRKPYSVFQCAPPCQAMNFYLH